MKEMETVKNLLDGRVYKNPFNRNFYKVSRVVNSRAVLNSLDGESQILTDLSNLKLFYETVDYRDGS